MKYIIYIYIYINETNNKLDKTMTSLQLLHLQIKALVCMHFIVL